MFAILSNVTGSLLWGALVTLLALGMLYAILKLSFSRFRISFLGGVVLVVFSVLLFVQGSLMTGAIYVRNMVTDIGAVERIGQRFAPVADYLDESGVQDKLPEEVQEGVETQVQAATDAALAVVDGTRDAITAYVWRRVAWMAGFWVLAGILLARTRKKAYQGISYDQMTDLDF